MTPRHHLTTLLASLTLPVLVWTNAGSASAYTTDSYNWSQVPIGGTGNISCLVIHPKVKDVMYIGADVGGVDRWDAENKKWIPTFNYYGALQGCDALAIDPTDTTGNIVYAAMGSYDYAKPPGAIYKSIDRGEHWTPSVTPFRTCSNGDQGWNNRLVVDPANGNVVYYGSRDGLYRSTDAGVNWTKLSSAPPGDQTALGKGKGPSGIVMVILDPSSGTTDNPVRTKRIYITPFGSPLSKSEDGGETWATMPNATTDVSCAALDPDGVLYCASWKGGLTKYTGGPSGTWSTITPEKLGHGGNGYCSIQVDPFNKNNILAMENYMPCYSTDGGATWAYIAAQGYNQSTHATPDWYNPQSQSQFGWGGKNLRFDPFVKSTVWESDCFLTWKTDDIYAKVVHWESFTAGHEETVGTAALLSPPSGPTLLYSGAADVYGFRHTSLTDWPTQILLKRYNANLEIDGGDFEEKDPNFAAFVGATGWNGPGAGGYTTDGGVSFQNFPHTEKLPANQGGRVAISCNSRNIVWATGYSAQSVSYSKDLGATWATSAGLPAETPVHLGFNIFFFMSPICSDRVNGDKFYFYNKEGAFYRSTDGGASFTQVSQGLPKTIQANLVANFTKEGDLWLSLKGIGLWHSIDGGLTWTRVANVQQSDMVAIGKGPNETSASIYLLGKVDNDKNPHFFRSDDLGVSWIKIDIERPYPNGAIYMCGDRRNYGGLFVESSTGIYYGQKSNAPTLTQTPPGTAKPDKS
jgi:photosystem II stability/assembly factor-like uncharacterized protein